uniref:hypothetical protein n=1 Tax=uncultured Sphingomonas sp. TaxID=158754 RepID=UPI0035C9F4E4
MSATVPTAAELRDTLAHILAGAAGGTEEEWRAAIGEIEKLPTWANIRSNWAVHPTGSAKQLAAIEKAVEVVRAAQPYVAG